MSLGVLFFFRVLLENRLNMGIWLREKYWRQVFLLDSRLPACINPNFFSLICNKCVIILKQLKSKTKSPQAVTGLISKRIQIPHSATWSSVGTITIIIRFFFSVYLCSSPRMPRPLIPTHTLHTHTFNFYSLISCVTDHIQRLSLKNLPSCCNIYKALAF